MNINLWHDVTLQRPWHDIEVELHRTLCAHDHIEKVVSVSQETRYEIDKMFVKNTSVDISLIIDSYAVHFHGGLTNEKNVNVNDQNFILIFRSK